MEYTLAFISPASPCCRSFATAAPAATIAGSYATARQAPLSQAPTAATGYTDSFATARPAGAGQLGPGGSGDYAETFATAKQASAPLGAPESFATAKARPADYKNDCAHCTAGSACCALLCGGSPCSDAHAFAENSWALPCPVTSCTARGCLKKIQKSKIEFKI